MKRDSAPAVLLVGDEAIACYMLTSDGQLGERFCQVRYWDHDPYRMFPFPFAYIRGAMLVDDSVARYSSLFVVRAAFGTDHATVTMLSFEVGGGDAQLAHLFNQPDGMYAIWTSKNADGTTTAGLGQVGSDDVVRMVGAPFFVGNAVSSIVGAFDPQTDRFLVDSPDSETLVELDRNGNLLAATLHGQASGPGMETHPTNWMRLSTGRWVGLNGGWLCNFDPHDRTTTTCFRMQLGQDVPSANSLPIALNVDADGSLWAFFRVGPSYQVISTGVSLGRYDGNDRFEGPFVPLTLDTCAIPIPLN